VRDIAWYGTDGKEISDKAWGEGWNRSIGLMLNGRTLREMDDEGRPVMDDSFLILVNAAAEGVEYVLPEPPDGNPWRQVLDTENLESPFCDAAVDGKAILGGRSIRVYSDCTEEILKSPVRYKPTRTL
jgi:glycogen operon protein